MRVIADQQWTPELAEDIARADIRSVYRLLCQFRCPDRSRSRPFFPLPDTQEWRLITWARTELLALGHELYHSLPAHALSLTIGAGSIELGETFSDPVNAALPDACTLIEETVLRLIRE